MTGTLMEPALLSDREVYSHIAPRRSEALSDRELDWSATRTLVVTLREIPSSPPSVSIEIREEGAADSLVEIDEATPEGAPRWLPRLAKRAAELLLLPEGWDTYGAARVECHAIGYALRLLLLVSSSNTLTPSIVPLPDGSVQIEWHTGESDLEVGVAENGMLHVYAPGLNGQDEWESDFQPGIVRLQEIVSRFS